MAYVCRIELDDIEPKIWREFHFDPDVTFHQLHAIIQLVMGWEDYHQYEFYVNGQAIGVPDPSFEPMRNRSMNARKEIVREHIKQEQTSFQYMYDFGDGWEHTIRLLRNDEADDSSLPVCLGGERSCPPEDVGGVWGYQRMLEALRSPDDSESSEMLDWLPEGYDAEAFSHKDVNAELHRKKSRLVPKAMKAQKARPESAKSVKLTKSALNKHLKQMSAEQLAELVKDCYGASKEMEKFLAVKLLGEEAVASLFQEYCKKVESEFFPARGVPKLRLQEAKRAIEEFERLTGSVRYCLELKLVYVENGISFAQAYGEADARFYNSLITMYADMIDAVGDDVTGELLEEFGQRLGEIVSNAEEIGWDVHEILHDLYVQIS